MHLLWACFNPTKADRGRRPTQIGELLGELDAPVEREEAIQAGARLKEAIARIEPRLRPRLAARPTSTAMPADDRGRDDRGAHDDGVASLGDADSPAVRAVRVRARAGAPARAPAAEARLPQAVHDQPRRGVPRPGAGLRPLRAGARVRGAAVAACHRPADRAVSRLDLRAAPRPRAGPGSERAVGGGRLLHRADRVGRRLQGQRGHVPPAAAVGERAAAGARRGGAGAQVPDRQRRGHAAPGGDQVRLADRDPVRVRRPRPHRRALEPLRRAAPKPHAADRRPLRLGEDDDRQRARCPAAWRRARGRS